MKKTAYQEADDELETEKHLLRDRCPADHVTTFEDEAPLAGARKVGGGNEAVVSPADHDRLILRCQGDDLLLRRSVDDHQKTRGAGARNGGGVISFLRGPRYQEAESSDAGRLFIPGPRRFARAGSGAAGQDTLLRPRILSSRRWSTTRSATPRECSTSLRCTSISYAERTRSPW